MDSVRDRWLKEMAEHEAKAEATDTPPATIKTSACPVFPPNFYRPNARGNGVPWLAIPSRSKIRVAIVSREPESLIHHYLGGNTWSLPVCSGEGCKYCPGDRRRYGYAHVISTINYTKQPGRLQYAHFVLCLTPKALEDIGDELHGLVYDLWRERSEGGRHKADKIQHGKAMVRLVRESCSFRLPQPIDLRLYLMRRLLLERWPVVQIGDVPELTVWKEQA